MRTFQTILTALPMILAGIAGLASLLGGLATCVLAVIR